MNGPSHLRLRGVAIPDDPRIFPAELRKAVVEGWYEAGEADALEGLIGAGERILELGSAIGYITTLMARDRRTAEILCFEADPKLVEFSRTVHQLNGIKNVRVENAILTTDDGVSEVKFYVRGHFWASSTFAKPWGYQSEVMVPAKSLAEVIADFRPTLIVCDIEGGEADLFEHADIASIHKVMLEVHPEIIGLARIKEFFHAMSRNGLIYDTARSSGKIVTFQRPRAENPGGKAI
jgi:FkbM family methyltransferase